VVGGYWVFGVSTFKNFMKIKISPSILSADFGRLNEEIASVESYCDMIHVDVMDGHFVPNITIGPLVVKKMVTGLPICAHLMIENPLKFAADFAKAGADRIIVHSEASEDLPGLLRSIKDLGVEVGVSIKPKTPVSEIEGVLGLVDEVLVMTVEPGFGGQDFMSDIVPKIKKLRELGFELDIGVDGGINAETAKVCVEAGANVLVAGSFIFKAKDRVERIKELRA
jgi:ribulose-phosphate 3-epimerase